MASIGVFEAKNRLSELVERAALMARSAGRRVASVAEARALLGVGQPA